ncbi:MAG: NADP-dependent oxidoreductase [Microscillaceae bacterium]|nr:NADP-dependent oxidoreductase [Microscillaceae bacterium]
MTLNKQFRLAKRPLGTPTRENWEFVTEAIPTPAEGQVLVQNLFISLDPAMRGWMNEGKSYIPPVGIGEVMRAGTAGKVVASQHPGFAVGDYVSGALGVQSYGLSDGKGLYKVDTNLAPLSTHLGLLGMVGMTAYFGLLDVGQPKEGETVLISGAAGAVGGLVGQIAKIKGCHTVGIAGGAEKCRYVVDELGFDACIDYKSEDLRTAIKAHTPKGVDVFFDNVGGETLDLALTRINLKARVVICGAISQYNNTSPVQGPSNYLSLLVNRARMEGFVVFDYTPRFREAVVDMVGWLKAGQLKNKEHQVEGIEAFPEALLMLFKGENFGKLMLALPEEA